MPTNLLGIANRASTHKAHRFRNLSGELSEEYLLECWGFINKNAASGVDKMSAQEYGKNLTSNIHDLVERLKRGSYRAQLIRRHWIPKGTSDYRPLGIPVVEDKLLQMGVSRILEAIYEQDFMRCSYGYRPEKGAHRALDKLTVKLQFGGYTTVVEADIKGFFNNMDHEKLVEMLEQRIDDKRFIRLIRKWLRAGILEEGQITHPTKGTPQGGVVSPILSNIYLHHVLDVWFHRDVRPRMTGEAMLIRYCDDFVCAFEVPEEAELFLKLLRERMEQFNLELSEEKTNIISFNRGRPDKSFDFLGFEFRWGKDRQGKEHLKRQTARKSFRQSLKRLTAFCRENRTLKRGVFMERLNRKLRGTYAYYGLTGNSKQLWRFFMWSVRIVMKWLNRGNQRRSYNWVGFTDMMKTLKIERPRIMVKRYQYAT